MSTIRGGARRVAPALLLLLALALPRAAHAWQDLTEAYVRSQLEILHGKRASAAERLRASWALLDAGRAAVAPLGGLARAEPAFTWEAVRLLDLIRGDAAVVRIFSELLDRPPAGFKPVRQLGQLLRGRLAEMLGRDFGSDDRRRSWVKENADHLAYDPARLVFVVDEAARRAHRMLVPTPPAASAQAEAEAAYGRLILALHLGNVEEVRRLVGPRVRLERHQNRQPLLPALDLDAFFDRPWQHRAILVRQDGARVLVRSARAYFRFERQGQGMLCVEAGLKPID